MADRYWYNSDGQYQGRSSDDPPSGCFSIFLGLIALVTIIWGAILLIGFIYSYWAIILAVILGIIAIVCLLCGAWPISIILAIVCIVLYNM